jgi:hypothetical protein
MKHRTTSAVVVTAFALTACGGRTASGDAGEGSPNDGGVDALNPTVVAETIKLDCMQFCAQIETSFPQCTQLITTPARPVSCATWCEVPDAEATRCAAEALAYFGCVVRPGILQGCVVEAGVGFVFPACEAAANAVFKCLHPQ